MTRILAPMVLILATALPALASGIVFEIPRFDFPAPDSPVATDSVSTQNR